LGAGEKLFEPFDFSPFQAKTISFLVPEKKESLQHYCRRLSIEINREEENIYIGVSFGGILAQEIAKEIPPRKIILISSIKSNRERPWYFGWIRRIPVHQTIPPAILKKILLFISENVTIKTPKERRHFRVMVDEADNRVIQWGITQVANWKQASVPKNLIHIHGDRDLVFPIRKIKADHIIKNGKHFMIMREISEINELIMSLLQTESVQPH
jgi:pimeloyl-ACP methyl ester carboxylesterase